jgi:hypothetical protein
MNSPSSLSAIGEKSTATDSPPAATDDGAWTYTTTMNLTPGQNVAIEVTATDRPGHKSTKVQPKG